MKLSEYKLLLKCFKIERVYCDGKYQYCFSEYLYNLRKPLYIVDKKGMIYLYKSIEFKYYLLNHHLGILKSKINNFIRMLAK